jgi:hypothetical protein
MTPAFKTFLCWLGIFLLGVCVGTMQPNPVAAPDGEILEKHYADGWREGWRKAVRSLQSDESSIGLRWVGPGSERGNGEQSDEQIVADLNDEEDDLLDDELLAAPL